jgi:murein DD-endopeptidase MepM/ murein hydrolase activator NlpD
MEKEEPHPKPDVYQRLRDLARLLRKTRRHAVVLLRYWKFIVGLGVASFVTGYWLHYSHTQERATRAVVTPPPKPLEQPYPHLVPPGSSLNEVLKGLGVDGKTTYQIVKASRPVINLARLRAGTRFRLINLTDPTSEVVGIDFQLTPVQSVEVRKVNGTWVARAVTEAVDSKVVTFCGVVRESLWESAERAKMDPDLIIHLAEIFAWQLDLAREVHLSDRWRLVVEQKLVKGKPVGWGSILVAEYQSQKQNHVAILFKLSEGNEAYYAEDGSSVRRMFLKSPMRFARITSRFSEGRFHPILKVNRPHLGVDYGAPRGTPARAVGDGVVTFAGWNGDSGKTLTIKHNAKYQTTYRHLSGFERGVMRGARVTQGQCVAFVGATGLATGPHLHFEFSVNGKVVDPLSVSSPPANPVPPDRLAEFREHAANALRGLPDWKISAASGN